jgi:hypothetical protein
MQMNPSADRLRLVYTSNAIARAELEQFDHYKKTIDCIEQKQNPIKV